MRKISIDWYFMQGAQGCIQNVIFYPVKTVKTRICVYTFICIKGVSISRNKAKNNENLLLKKK